MAWRGTWIGWVAFLAIAGIVYLTPARVPVMMLAGRDYAVLRLPSSARQLAPQGAAPALERERVGTAAAASRVQAWRRLNSGTTPFGFLGWVSDLWPWLLGLGIAFPALGGLIGAQIPGQKEKGKRQEGEEKDRERDGQEQAVRAVRAEVSGEYEDAHPPRGEDSEASPILPPGPAAWNWNARPARRATPPRPKPPPVKSPHGEKSEE